MAWVEGKERCTAAARLCIVLVFGAPGVRRWSMHYAGVHEAAVLSREQSDA
jgi:hypothetical protein